MVIFLRVGLYKLYIWVYNLTMDTNTTTKTPAAIIVEKMIADNNVSISLNERVLQNELAEMELQISRVRAALTEGLHFDSNVVRASAHKIEDAISKREVLAREARSLAYVLKAAQPAE